MELSIDVSGLVKAVDGMIHRIDHLGRVDIGAELSAWQVDDLHRHRPFTMRNRRAHTATTKIRPHSKYETQHSRRAFGRAVRRILRDKPTMYRHWSTRPILRKEMYDRLCERLRTM